MNIRWRIQKWKQARRVRARAGKKFPEKVVQKIRNEIRVAESEKVDSRTSLRLKEIDLNMRRIALAKALTSAGVFDRATRKSVRELFEKRWSDPSFAKVRYTQGKWFKSKRNQRRIEEMELRRILGKKYSVFEISNDASYLMDLWARVYRDESE